MERAVGLKAISRNGTGVDNLDLDAAARLGIAVLRADARQARGVAELTVGLMLALAQSHSALRSAHESRPLATMGGNRAKRPMPGTAGIRPDWTVGGRNVARLGHARGGVRPLVRLERKQREQFSPAGSLEEVLGQADVLSLHCPLPADRQPLLTRERLSLLKPGTYLINTARGELLDDTAVLEALEQGRLAGAAFDAYRREPPDDGPLVRHERVIATPHVGGYSRESIERAVEKAVDNLLVALRES